MDKCRNKNASKDIPVNVNLFDKHKKRTKVEQMAKFVLLFFGEIHADPKTIQAFNVYQ